MRSTLMLLAPALAAASVPAIFARGCGDNCARAVIGKSYTTRDGAADCAAFLRTTVTPDVVIVTATATESFSVTETSSVTETTLTTTTTLTTDVAVVKETAQETTTATIVTAALRKREEDAAPTIPAYASACSGEARYSTACSCVGVTLTTITAATPTSTVTVTESTTASFSETTTIATEVIVETSTSIESTTTTTTDATVTATQTAVVAPAQFRLRSTSGNSKNKWVNAQFGGAVGTVLSPLGFTGTKSDAAIFSFGANGQLNQVSGSNSAPVQAKSGDSSALVFVSKLNGKGVDYQPAVCGFTGVKLTCAWASSPTVVRSWGVTALGYGSLELGVPSGFAALSQTTELEIVAV